MNTLCNDMVDDDQQMKISWALRHECSWTVPMYTNKYKTNIYVTFQLKVTKKISWWYAVSHKNDMGSILLIYKLQPAAFKQFK